MKPAKLTGFVADCVREHAQTMPETVAVAAPHGTMTWSELNDSADRFAGLATALGLVPGDRVGWLGGNDFAFLPILLGAHRRRLCVVGLNWRLPLDEVSACIAESAPLLVVADLALTDQSFRNRHADLLVTVDYDAPSVPWATADPVGSLEARDSDTAMLFFTSGSTGRPKAVAIERGAHERLIADPMPFPVTAADRLLIIPPVFHVAGEVWAQYGLRYGATQFYLADATPAALLTAFCEHEITHAQLVPTLLQMIVTEMRRTGARLPLLREIVYGTAPISPRLLRDVMGLLDARLTQVYGLSEAGGVVANLEPREHVPGSPRLLSVGRVVEGGRIRIEDPDTGEVLPAGRGGEVVLDPPYMMQGYWNQPEATSAAIKDGWLHTRDFGWLDEDGYLYLQGRIDDMIITGGENVHPVAVEAVLTEMPGVTECAVFGVPDDKWGQRVAAVVVAGSPSVNAASVIEFCRARLAHYQCPTSVMLLDALPRNATGKVIRKDLERRALATG